MAIALALVCAQGPTAWAQATPTPTPVPTTLGNTTAQIQRAPLAVTSGGLAITEAPRPLQPLQAEAKLWVNRAHRPFRLKVPSTTSAAMIWKKVLAQA